LLLFCFSIISLSCGVASGQGPEPPLFHLPTDRANELPPEEPLWPDGAPGEKPIENADATPPSDKPFLDRHVSRVQSPTIAIHRPPADRNNGRAVVICPGGGYGILAIDKEGHDVARWLNSLGITGIVLKYRLKEYGHPAPLADVQRAISTVRHRAEKLGIDPAKIGVMGFSAGGHVASTAGTHFHTGRPDIADPIDRTSNRPDFMILVYPVITMQPGAGHDGSRRNLLGENPGQELIDNYSNDQQVTDQSPPTFLVHTADDPVKIENSVLMFRALQGHRVAVEFAIYARGGHGYGLGNSGQDVDEWPQRCAAWLKSL
jgi:acetyl esterase/lipase